MANGHSQRRGVPGTSGPIKRFVAQIMERLLNAHRQVMLKHYSHQAGFFWHGTQQVFVLVKQNRWPVKRAD